ncbi:MAG: LL-diaminopimelate aminotransferase [Prevotellaceae bacterium]|jgi:LL-diaminopimelate aminotransferase|nr:LL-diaminopimelate aminotransferase [Prevotellaceae bacterium]
MALVNEHYLKLSEDYFFTEIEKRINAFSVTHPKSKVIRLGVGDVSRPLPSEAVSAMHAAIDELADEETFRGYGPGEGYRFLIDKIIKFDYQPRGVSLDADEIFISDGAKTDTGNLGHILGRDNIIAITDPVYPVYENAAIMSGRAGRLTDEGKWSNIVYINCTPENGFKPELPAERVDVIYLCYPNNPTGTVLTKAELKQWVDYAIENQAVIIYDGAYEAYITEEDIPRSIYEIKGAKKVAIEVRSFSKTAGFTGLRCSYTVVPKELIAYTLMGDKIPLNKLWLRRQTTYFNGSSYVAQRGAEATYTRKGKKQIADLIEYYLTNAGIIRKELKDLGFTLYGGINSPYIWVKTLNDMPSWKFFQQLLYEANIVGTPGSGFGLNGEGYFRFSGFCSRENVEEAMVRMRKWV